VTTHLPSRLFPRLVCAVRCSGLAVRLCWMLCTPNGHNMCIMILRSACKLRILRVVSLGRLCLVVSAFPACLHEAMWAHTSAPQTPSRNPGGRRGVHSHMASHLPPSLANAQCWWHCCRICLQVRCLEAVAEHIQAEVSEGPLVVAQIEAGAVESIGNCAHGFCDMRRSLAALWFTQRALPHTKVAFS
jgi:hypothetical protein